MGKNGTTKEKSSNGPSFSGEIRIRPEYPDSDKKSVKHLNFFRYLFEEKKLKKDYR